jgi:YHS domain-containing protein
MSFFHRGLLLTVVGLSLTTAACDKKAAPPPAPAAGPANAAVGAVGSPTKLAVGAKAHCPVTGEDFVVAETTSQVEHEGKYYAFCCPECQPAFTKDPAKYIKKN